MPLLATLLLALAAGDGASAIDPAFAAAQQQVTDAFMQADAERLAATLSQKMKTYVACAPLGLGDGYFGADQMRLMLRRLFRDRETVRFRALPPPAVPRSDGSAVVMILWSYREAGAPPTDARLTLTFARESGAWRVREIRELK